MTVRRVALVTGAASGIGAAIARRQEEEGWSVMRADLTPSDAVDSVTVDLTSAAANRAAVDAAIERFGRLDAVIANAGFQRVAPIEELSEESWETMIALLLTSPFLLAKYSWPHLRSSDRPRFVAVASVHAQTASPFKAPYVSAKHGVLGLIKTLALEGAEDGIVAAAVCPSYVRTPLVESQIAAQAAAHETSEQRVLDEVLLRRQAVKELIEPEEVAAAVAFLLGEAGASFTGASLDMTQGWLAS